MFEIFKQASGSQTTTVAPAPAEPVEVRLHINGQEHVLKIAPVRWFYRN
jgi:hypothetical protein